MNKINNFKVGSDIEFFLQDKETKEIVSAEGLIRGSKHDPFHFDPNNHFFATSLDNVMAEGNIPPAQTPFEFYQSVEVLRKFINSEIPQNLETVSLPSARLDEKYLQTENARLFGCDPSFNCWTHEMVHPQPKEDNIRSTGFHVHIGYENPSEEANVDLARAMDLYLGVPAVLMEPINERKKVGYGCAGNYRHQKHGMEYRSLSGYFANDQKLTEWCFRAATKAVEFVNAGRVNELDGLAERIQNTINNEDKEAAKQLIENFNLELA